MMIGLGFGMIEYYHDLPIMTGLDFLHILQGMVTPVQIIISLFNGRMILMILMTVDGKKNIIPHGGGINQPLSGRI